MSMGASLLVVAMLVLSVLAWPHVRRRRQAAASAPAPAKHQPHCYFQTRDGRMLPCPEIRGLQRMCLSSEEYACLVNEAYADRILAKLAVAMRVPGRIMDVIFTTEEQRRAILPLIPAELHVYMRFQVQEPT